MDLLTHRVIKVNGCYAVTAASSGQAYRGGKLNGTIVLSRDLRVLRTSGHVDTSMADGAAVRRCQGCVMGYVNNVYTVYSRSMLWATVNRLIEGETCSRPWISALRIYGADDIVWYSTSTPGRSHAAASYPDVQRRPKRPAHRARHGSGSAVEQQTPAAA